MTKPPIERATPQGEKAKRKVWQPIKGATYTLQFWRDKHGTPMCTETANKGDIDYSIDMLIFGRGIAKSKLLDSNDKTALSNFCRAFLEEINNVEGMVTNFSGYKDFRGIKINFGDRVILKLNKENKFTSMMVCREESGEVVFKEENGERKFIPIRFPFIKERIKGCFKNA